jgi:glycogen debranching enzyme
MSLEHDPAGTGTATRGVTAAPGAETVHETPFYIPAGEDSARPTRTLKQGDSFAVLDAQGDMGATSGAPDGLFHADTRYLSRLELALNGVHPLLLGSSVRDDNSVLTVDLTNPDLYFEKRIVLPKDTVHIVRTIFLTERGARQRYGVKNYGDQAVDLNLSFGFDADFADLFEVRGMRRDERGISSTETVPPGQVVFGYTGLDGTTRTTSIAFEPAPQVLSRHSAVYSLRLAPGERISLFVTIACDDRDLEPTRAFFIAMRSTAKSLRAHAGRGATIETSNQLFNEVLSRSRADLAMLVTDTEQGPYPYAGIPWYSTSFGRDGIITAMQMLWCDPSLARGVLRRLAACQARETIPEADAEPGKILHEMRAGEMAILGEVPFRLYYGSVDATPLFVMLAGMYVQRTGDVDLIRELWPHIEAALAWIDGAADQDGDGFLQYARAHEKGLANQGWKDSFDSVFHADGRLAEGAIALAEVQGYVFAARHMAAHCARLLGDDARADALAARAGELTERFERSFWCDELGTYAIAIDGDKKPCRVATSNAGHLLFTGLAEPDRAHRVATGLMSAEFFAGWGIRTVAEGAARYNPMSYHNGSIWPHDNALIALGLARYGEHDAVDRVFTALFDAAVYMDLRRLPELYCGFKRQRGRGPTLYPVACSPQAWAAATPFALLQASLGIEFEPGNHEIRLRNPHLPAFLDDVTIRGLRLGTARVDLVVQRVGREIAVRVIRNEGRIQVGTVYG